MSGVVLDSWRLATGTLTRVPVTAPTRVDQVTAAWSIRLAPLAVFPVVAGAVAVANALTRLGVPPLAASFALVGAMAWASRGLHLDGLSDTVDGLAASFDAPRSLEVMKSGTAGPAGVVAIVVVVGLQVAALESLLATDSWAVVAVAAALCCSRTSLMVCCSTPVPSAREDGLGVLFSRTQPILLVSVWWLIAAVLTGAAGIAAGLPWWRGALAAAVGLVAAGAVTRVAVHRLGGVTGDVYGAAVELSLVVMLVVLS